MIHFFSEATSTNAIAIDLLSQGCPAGTIIHAERQTAGRGQYGREFASPPGGLYFSLVLRPDLSPTVLPLVTLATGVACCEELDRLYALTLRLKWPNDLYAGNKKLGGILCESRVSGNHPETNLAVVIGVGINATSTAIEFPEALQPVVTTLRDCSPFQRAIADLRDQLATAITRKVEALGADRRLVLSQWQQRDYLLGKQLVHRLGDDELLGLGCGVDEQGRYLIQLDNGEIRPLLGGQLRLALPAL